MWKDSASPDRARQRPSAQRWIVDLRAGQLTAVVATPPVTSTRPSGSRVAVWTEPAVLIEPVSDQVPSAGSYISALAKDTALSLTTAADEHPAVWEQSDRV